jgi:hypothetical protein
MSTRLVTVQTGISSVVGQATSAMSNYIINSFPLNFFKTYLVLTEDEAIREYRRLAEKRDLNEFKRRNPVLSILPDYSIENTVHEPHEDWKHVLKFGHTAKNLINHYPTFFVDVQNDKYGFVLPKRHRVNMEINIRVESRMVMWDVLSYLKHLHIFENYFYLNKIPMSCVIPNQIVYALAYEYGLDLHQRNDRNEFLSILRSNSYNSIDEIVDPAKNNSFYILRFYPNFLVRMNAPSAEAIKRNQSNFNGEVKFSLETEFSCPTNFITEFTPVRDEFGHVIDLNEFDESSYTRRYTIPNVPPIIELDNGRKIIFFKGFITDATGTLADNKMLLGYERVTSALMEPSEYNEYEEVVPQIFITTLEQLEAFLEGNGIDFTNYGITTQMLLNIILNEEITSIVLMATYLQDNGIEYYNLNLEEIYNIVNICRNIKIEQPDLFNFIQYDEHLVAFSDTFNKYCLDAPSNTNPYLGNSITPPENTCYSTFKISSPDGRFALMTDDLDISPRKKPYRVEIIASSKEYDSTYVLEMGGKFSKIFKFTQANQFQKFNFDFDNVDSRYISFIIKPFYEDGRHEINIAKFSLKELIHKISTDGIEDYVYLEDHLPSELLRFIALLLSRGLNPSDYISIMVTQLGGRIVPDGDINIDWQDLILRLKNMFCNYTHYVSFYVNLEEFKNILGTEEQN